MSDYEELPKGMHKLPAEFSTDQTTVPVTHDNINYSSLIRKNLKLLEKDGLFVKVKRVELLEQEDSHTIASFIIEIRSTK